MKDLQVFNNDLFGEVRALNIDNEPWFVGKDVAKVLGYADVNRAVRQHVDKEDLKVCNRKGYGDLVPSLWNNENDFANKILINESGLYSLIFNSELPSAKQFKRWVTSEVLPSLRKNGVYAVTNEIKIDLSETKAFLEKEEKLLNNYKQVLGNPKKITNVYVNTIKRELGVSSAKHKDYLNVKEFILNYFEVETLEALPKDNMSVLNKIIQICRSYDPGWNQLSLFDEE